MADQTIEYVLALRDQVSQVLKMVAEQTTTLEKANQELAAITAKANADRVTELERIDAAMRDQIELVNRLAQVTGETAEVQAARNAILQRGARDVARYAVEANGAMTKSTTVLKSANIGASRAIGETTDRLGAMQQKSETLESGIMALAGAIGMISPAAANGVRGVGDLIGGLGGVTRLIGPIVAAAGPIAIVAVAIGAVIAAYAVLANAHDKATQGAQDLTTSLERLHGSLDPDLVRAANQSWEQYQKISQDVEIQNAVLTGTITEQEAATMKQVAAVRESARAQTLLLATEYARLVVEKQLLEAEQAKLRASGKDPDRSAEIYRRLEALNAEIPLAKEKLKSFKEEVNRTVDLVVANNQLTEAKKKQTAAIREATQAWKEEAKARQDAAKAGLAAILKDKQEEIDALRSALSSAKTTSPFAKGEDLLARVEEQVVEIGSQAFARRFGMTAAEAQAVVLRQALAEGGDEFAASLEETWGQIESAMLAYAREARGGDSLGDFVASFQKAADSLESFLGSQAGNLSTSALMGNLGPALAALGPVGAVAGVVQGIGAAGGAEGVEGKLTQTLDEILLGLQDLPTILADTIPDFAGAMLEKLPTALMEAAPQLVAASLRGQWELFKFLVVELPVQIAKQMLEVGFQWIQKLVDFIKDFFDALIHPFKGAKNAWGKVKEGIGEAWDWAKGLVPEFAIGGFVPTTGPAILHAGERVVPPSGMGTQTAAAMGGAGVVLNIYINALEATPSITQDIVRALEKYYGSKGLRTSSVLA